MLQESRHTGAHRGLLGRIKRTVCFRRGAAFIAMARLACAAQAASCTLNAQRLWVGKGREGNKQHLITIHSEAVHFDSTVRTEFGDKTTIQ